jgi:CAAX prenyl protease-like protein
LPLAVFLVGTQLEGAFSGPELVNYPWVYAAKIVATTLALGWAWPAVRQFPFRYSPYSVLLGLGGCAVWIAVTNSGWDAVLLRPLGWNPTEHSGRAAYNPLESLGSQTWQCYAFLAVRFFGLAVIVPIIEELFYRAFLMRFVVRPDWWVVPLGLVTPMALAVGTFFPALAHPGELLAAIIWFGVGTWLLVSTRSLWDCIVYHAVTNLALGVYVLKTGDWKFW